MKKILGAMIIGLCASSGAYAQDQQVLQVFACNFNDGKNLDNLAAWIEDFREFATSGENQDPGAGSFAWLPFRGAAPYDYILGFISSSLNDMATGVQGYYASPQGQALEAQANETADCISGIVMSEQLRNGVIGNTGDDQLDAVVELFSCTLNRGSDLDDVRSASDFLNKQIDAIGSAALSQYESYLWTPYRGGTGNWDFLWVGNHSNLSTWAQADTDYYGSKEGQAAEERFQKISTCTNSMWGGYWIVPPAEGPTAE